MRNLSHARSGILIALGAGVLAIACEGEPRPPTGDADVPGAPGTITPDLDREPRPVLRDTVRQEQLEVETIAPPPPAPID